MWFLNSGPKVSIWTAVIPPESILAHAELFANGSYFFTLAVENLFPCAGYSPPGVFDFAGFPSVGRLKNIVFLRLHCPDDGGQGIPFRDPHDIGNRSPTLHQKDRFPGSIGY